VECRGFGVVIRELVEIFDGYYGLDWWSCISGRGGDMGKSNFNSVQTSSHRNLVLTKITIRVFLLQVQFQTFNVLFKMSTSVFIYINIVDTLR